MSFVNLIYFEFFKFTQIETNTPRQDHKDLQDVLDARKTAFGDRWKVDGGSQTVKKRNQVTDEF